jgi:hypothetical protein
MRDISGCCEGTSTLHFTHSGADGSGAVASRERRAERTHLLRMRRHHNLSMKLSAQQRDHRRVMSDNAAGSDNATLQHIERDNA